MPNLSPAPRDDVDRRHFPRQWFRSLIPFGFAVVAFGMFADRVPGGVWYAVPGLCLVTAFALALHGGLILTRDGIEWYAVHPRWRFRRVPWSAVLDARPGWLGAGHSVRLVVADGRYEPWVWGTPEPGGRREVVVHTRDLAEGAAVWDAIRDARARREVTAGVGTTG